jgi:hypothetical protein
MSAQVQAATPAEAMPIGPACMKWRTDCDGVPKDIAIRKQKPPGFFGTNLAIHLTLLCCDSDYCWDDHFRLRAPHDPRAVATSRQLDASAAHSVLFGQALFSATAAD